MDENLVSSPPSDGTVPPSTSDVSPNNERSGWSRVRAIYEDEVSMERVGFNLLMLPVVIF
jgi:hypothetical protein